MKIWQRYFYKEIITTFVLLLFSFYSLYVILDVMAHMKDIREGHTSIRTWIVFYLCTFSRRLDVLLPFVVLIGTIRVLLYFRSQNTLVSLLTGGLSLRQLLKPFLVVSLAISAILYVNFQWILPTAQPKAQFIQENSFSKKSFSDDQTTFRECVLQDGSKILYRAYDPTSKSFYDVFWVSSIDKIYHMKCLACYLQVPYGKMVDLIVRLPNGRMQKSESFVERSFPEMNFDEEALKRSIISPKDQSLSQLFSQVLHLDMSTERNHEALTHFAFKMTYPFLILVAFMAIPPFCIRFTRTNAPFMIYLIAISSLFCFLLLLQVFFVLAKTHTVPVSIAFTVPWLLVFFVTGRRYVRSFQ